MFFIFEGGGWYRISRVVCKGDVNLGNRERSTKERGGWRNCDGYAATNAGSSLLMDFNRCVETKIAPEFILASPNPRFEPERKSSVSELNIQTLSTILTTAITATSTKTTTPTKISKNYNCPFTLISKLKVKKLWLP